MGKKEIDLVRKINKTIVNDDGTFENFEKQLVKLMFGKFDKAYPMVVSTNSDCMSYIDAVDTGSPLIINVSTVDKLRSKHGIGYEFVSDCENMLRNSVLAFGSMQHDSSIVVVLDEFDKKTGNPFVAICRLDKSVDGGALLVNEITSVYDKDRVVNFLVRSYLNEQPFYKNEKTEQYFAPFGLQLPEDVKYALSDAYYKPSFTKSQVENDILLAKNEDFSNVDDVLADAKSSSASLAGMKKVLYVDMDGTLARFHDVEKRFIEEMWSPGFYVNMKPFENLTAAIALFINRNPDVEVYLLSAVLDTDPPFIEGEKNAWMDRYLPEIDGEHRIFTKAGEDKSKYLNMYGRECFLLDDYNKNLYEFETAGGLGIKFCNDINHRGMGEFGGSKGFLWTGAMVHYESSPQQLCRNLEEIVFGRTKPFPIPAKEYNDEDMKQLEDDGACLADLLEDAARRCNERPLVVPEEPEHVL